MALFHEQALTPLPYRSLPASRVVDAFRVMQQARHIGKIVVSQNGNRPDISLPPCRLPHSVLSRMSAGWYLADLWFWPGVGPLAGSVGPEAWYWLAAVVWIHRVPATH
jgi:hypothetical protein